MNDVITNKIRLSKKFFMAFFIIIFFVSIRDAHAAKVSQVKGSKVLIDLDGDKMDIGDEFFTINTDGKKIGLIKISQTREGKAIGEISKGKAVAGNKLLQKNNNSTGSQATKNSDRNSTTNNRNKNSAGIIIGYHMQNMTASYKGGAENKTYSLDMNGNNISYYGFYNYRYAPDISIELGLGLYKLNVATTISESVCIGGTKNCFVDINYLNGSVLGKYVMKMKHPFWFGAGVDFLMPTGKATTVLDKNNISFNQQFRLAAGMDLHIIGKSAYIPLQFDYSLFPPSAEVKASAISIRFGYGMYF